jgi:hypothetical protein
MYLQRPNTRLKVLDFFFLYLMEAKTALSKTFFIPVFAAEEHLL